MKMLFILATRRSATTALQHTGAGLIPNVQYFDGGVLPGGRARNECHLLRPHRPRAGGIRGALPPPLRRPAHGDRRSMPRRRFRPLHAAVGLVKSTRLPDAARAGSGSRPGRPPPRTRSGSSASPLRWYAQLRQQELCGLALRNGPRLRPETAQEVWSEAYQRLLDDAAFATAAKWLRVEDVVDRPHEQIRRRGLVGSRLYTVHPLAAGNRGRWRNRPGLRRLTRAGQPEIARPLATSCSPDPSFTLPPAGVPPLDHWRAGALAR